MKIDGIQFINSQRTLSFPFRGLKLGVVDIVIKEGME